MDNYREYHCLKWNFINIDKIPGGALMGGQTQAQGQAQEEPQVQPEENQDQVQVQTEVQGGDEFEEPQRHEEEDNQRQDFMILFK